MDKSTIPKIGISDHVIFKNFNDLKEGEISWEKGKTFGAVYFPGEHYAKVISKAYNMFMHENAFDPQLFQSLLSMENEIIQQVGQLLSAGNTVYGNLTSGGTESIFLALLSARDWSSNNKDIDNPEVILCSTAHPAFLKAMRFLKIKPIVISPNKDLSLDIIAFEKAITENTILLVGSAPCYPYGMIDPIDQLSDLAINNNLLLHVDACIGGFLLSFLKKLNYDIPHFDFSLNGVTSISVDLHKYAYAPKGSSVLLYKDSSLRKSQFSVYSNWEGGVYASTTFMGTKPGGIVASSWTALNHIGENGYLELTKKTMQATFLIRQFIEEHQDLFLIGNPAMSLLAFSCREINIYQLADQLNDRGWYIGRLQDPPAIHLVVSQIHANGPSKEFIKDVAEVIVKLKKKSIGKIVENVQDKLALKLLNLMSFSKLKKTILSNLTKQSTSKNKKRIIYGLKENLEAKNSDELFRSIIDQFYK